MPQTAIHVRNLSKRYVVASVRQRHDTLRDELAESLRLIFRRNGNGRSPSQELFWALRDVSFDVKQGEVVGIIGRNGAGKSTLLKLLSRITEPTGGRAEIYGCVGSLLEVGTGFDRELTGRENAYLSGAILGMRKREIDRKFDEIVAFSEVERFIDTPVKRYSSGMYLRLAFAVAAHLEPDILILDEVLAVGDAKFQARCLGKMGDIAAHGRTVLFVSHNMAAVTRFCSRCIWLEEGRIREDGPSEDVVAKYLTAGVSSTAEVVFADDNSRPGSEFVRLRAVRVRNRHGEITGSADSGEPISIEIEYQTLRSTTGLRVGTSLIGRDGSTLLSTMDLDSLPEDLHREPGRYISRCDLPGEFLNDGQYFVSVGSDFPMIQSHFTLDRVLSFRVESLSGSSSHVAAGRGGMLRMKLPWQVQRLET